MIHKRHLVFGDEVAEVALEELVLVAGIYVQLEAVLGVHRVVTVNTGERFLSYNAMIHGVCQ